MNFAQPNRIFSIRKIHRYSDVIEMEIDQRCEEKYQKSDRNERNSDKQTKIPNEENEKKEQEIKSNNIHIYETRTMEWKGEK